jgi:hypothetical protein
MDVGGSADARVSGFEDEPIVDDLYSAQDWLGNLPEVSVFRPPLGSSA